MWCIASCIIFTRDLVSFFIEESRTVAKSERSSTLLMRVKHVKTVVENQRIPSYKLTKESHPENICKKSGFSHQKCHA